MKTYVIHKIKTALNTGGLKLRVTDGNIKRADLKRKTLSLKINLI